jgi:mono/diheme cytochrome c family protein
MKSLKVLVVFLLLAMAGGAAFIWSGIYNIAANDPHWEITFELLEVVRDRSIANHSKGIAAPPLEDPKLRKAGFREFDEMCRQCHGAPGLSGSSFAMGMYPSPPNLASASLHEELKDAELFWIVRNGLKMTGMPSFGATHDDDELWAVVAFVKHLYEMKPADYKAMAEAERAEEAEGEHGGGGH